MVVCSWDGLTYIVDHDKSFVRFQFEENVCAFCAGTYTLIILEIFVHNKFSWLAKSARIIHNV